MSVFGPIVAFLEADRPDPDPVRRARLDEIARFVREHDEPDLVFICTHNSRRSHMAQLWAQAAADHFGVDLRTWSGGTEATAFHPNAVAAMRAAGFGIEVAIAGTNPVHRVRWSDAGAPLEVFSKRYDAPANPSRGFCAIMTCSTADADCPVVSGAQLRVALPYDDPGASDGSGREAEVYRERSRQIGAEMAWMVRRASG